MDLVVFASESNLVVGKSSWQGNSGWQGYLVVDRAIIGNKVGRDRIL